MTTTCTVTWPDGVTATLEIAADHPNDEAPVKVTGAGADRFTVWPERSRPTLIEREVHSILARSNATWSFATAGEYPDENDVR